jgi:predicted RNase H-like nuclease (RuvC/YqgF family)
MSDPCRSMRESKREAERNKSRLQTSLNRLLDTYAKKEFIKSAEKKVDSLKQDIYKVEQTIKQLRIDIKACMSKSTKKGSGKTVKTKDEASLNTPVNEPSHGTGTRTQV